MHIVGRLVFGVVLEAGAFGVLGEDTTFVGGLIKWVAELCQPAVRIEEGDELGGKGVTALGIEASIGCSCRISSDGGKGEEQE